MYETEGIGCELICRVCGRRHRLDEQYHFTDEIGSISAYYDRIRRMESRKLDSFSLSAVVRTKIHGANGGPIRRETGTCTLYPAAFRYSSDSVDFSIPTDKLPALAFSCGKEFELYYQDELYFFYPMEQPNQVARWALMVDLLHENNAKPTIISGGS